MCEALFLVEKTNLDIISQLTLCMGSHFPQHLQIRVLQNPPDGPSHDRGPLLAVLEQAAQVDHDGGLPQPRDQIRVLLRSRRRVKQQGAHRLDIGRDVADRQAGARERLRNEQRVGAQVDQVDRLDTFLPEVGQDVLGERLEEYRVDESEVDVQVFWNLAPWNWVRKARAETVYLLATLVPASKCFRGRKSITHAGYFQSPAP